MHITSSPWRHFSTGTDEGCENFPCTLHAHLVIGKHLFSTSPWLQIHFSLLVISNGYLIRKTNIAIKVNAVQLPTIPKNNPS